MQTRLRRLWYRLLLAGLTAVPLVLAVLSAGLLGRISSQFDQADAGVAEARTVLNESEDVLRLTVDLESGQRGFVVTGGEDFLDQYHVSAAELPNALGRLAAAADLMPSIQPIAARLETQVRARAQHAQDVIELLRSQGRQQAAVRVGLGDGKRLMDDVRAVAKTLQTAVESELSERHVAVGASLRAERRVALGLVVALMLLCVAMGVLLWEVMRTRMLVCMCAWSRTVEFEGEWLSFEDYLKRRFGIDTTHGISPEQAKQVRAHARRESTSDGFIADHDGADAKLEKRPLALEALAQR